MAILVPKSETCMVVVTAECTPDVVYYYLNSILELTWVQIHHLPSQEECCHCPGKEQAP